MKSKNPITDALVEAMKARRTTKDYYTLCCELEQSHARLLAALKYLSNDGKGGFQDREDGQGRSIQSRIERPIKLAEKLCASAAHQNAKVSGGGPLTHESKQDANPPFAVPLG